MLHWVVQEETDLSVYWHKCHYAGFVMQWLVCFVSDNVCTESFSLKITKRTLEKCQQNMESLTRHINR